MKTNVILVGIGACVCIMLYVTALFSQEAVAERIQPPTFSRNTTNESPSRNLDDEIILDLRKKSYNMSQRWQPNPFLIQLIMWEDGRVLVGKEVSRMRAVNDVFTEDIFIDYEYRFGKIDSEKIQTLIHSIETNLQLKNHQTTIRDFGFNATTYLLQVNFSDGMLTVETWDKHEFAERYPKVNVIMDKNDGSERGVLLLPDFYKGWKVIKKDIFDIRDEIMASADFQLVDVRWGQASGKLFIHNKSGKQILECTYPPMPRRVRSRPLDIPDNSRIESET